MPINQDEYINAMAEDAATGKPMMKVAAVLTGSKAEDAILVIPSNTMDLEKVSSGIYLGGSGDLKVTLKNGSTVTFTGLSSGVIHPISAKRIFATGTTATSILAVN